MNPLNRERKVLVMAQQLGLEWQNNPVQQIIGLCNAKIQAWLSEHSDIQTISDLERLVCTKLKLVIEEIWSDSDLARVMTKYVTWGDNVFASLESEFDDATYATLIERRSAHKRDSCKYVAVIDCRGGKAARRFFTRWHEIAHLLTLYRQMELPLHRSTSKRDALERLMDEIAGEIAFYGPLFTPALCARLGAGGHLTLGAVEDVRNRFCPEASFQSTLIACVARNDQPTLYIEAKIGYKKHEAEALNSRQLSFIDIKPEPKLRAVVVGSNDAARRSGLKVHKNMAIPASSIIAKLYGSDNQANASGEESLSIWRHSDGSAIGFHQVRIEAVRVKDRVLALITLAN